MEIKVELNYLRMAPRKVRQAVNLIRAKRVEEAQALLEFSTNRPAKSVLKLLKSAIVSAKNNFQLEPSNLYISKIFVDEGPKLKRWMPVSRGSAHPILKRTSHITLVLSEIKPASSKRVKRPGAKVKKEELPKEEIKVVSEAVRPEPQKEKPKFEREEPKKRKTGFSAIRRIFRRKAF